MKNKLFLSTTVAFVCMIGVPSPLFACVSDEPLAKTPPQASQRIERSPQDWWDFLQDPASSPSVDDYARACLCFQTSPAHKSQEVYALEAYIQKIQHAESDCADPTLLLATFNQAAEVFGALWLEGHEAYKKSYLAVSVYLLQHDKTLPCSTLLSFLNMYIRFSFEPGLALASTRYITHPDAAKTHKTHPVLAAHAYARANESDENKARILYGLALDQNPEQFTYIDLCQARRLFAKVNQHINASKAAHLLMAKEGDRDRFGPITPQVLLSCATTFMNNKEHKEALNALETYYELETGQPERYAYYITASCHMFLNDIERSCDYFDLALKAGVPMSFSDYRNMAFAFNNFKNFSRAAECMEKALAFPESKNHFKVLSEASSTFFRAEKYDRAKECAEMCLAMMDQAQDEGDRILARLNAACAYSAFEELEKAIFYWRQILDKEGLTGAHKLMAGLIFYKAGDFKTASTCFADTIKKNPEEIKTYPEHLRTIFLCHIDAGKKERAVELWHQYKDHFAHLLPMLKTPQPKKMHQRKRTKAPTLSRDMPFDHMALESLRATLAEDIVNEIQKRTEHVKNASHDGLAALREKILTLVTQAEGLNGSLRASHASTSGASSSSASSSSASSSSSSSSRESAPAPQGDAKTPLSQLRRLKDHIHSLTRDFDKEQAKIMGDAKKRAVKEWIALSAAEDSQLYVSSPTTSQKVTAPELKTRKAKTRGTAFQSAHAASSSASSSAASASPSSSCAPASTLTNVEWRITPTVQKQLKTLKTVRGLQGKFDAFRHEIEMEPWGRRGHAATHASGRAKRLKGYENVFSRRLAGGERFIYRVEYAANGRVIVTILGLMEHDL